MYRKLRALIATKDFFFFFYYLYYMCVYSCVFYTDVVEFIKTEENLAPRAAVIGLAGLTGVVLARKGESKKIT